MATQRPHTGRRGGIMALCMALLVAMLSPQAASAQSLAITVALRPELRTLTAAILACPSLSPAATDPTTAVTVFAPSDQAFTNALTALQLTATDLLQNQPLLCGILSYHVLPQVARSTDVPAMPLSLPTLLAGSNVTVQTRSGNVFVNAETRVTVADLPAGRSIVHIVDRVLLPPTIAGVAAATPALSTLLLVARASPPIFAAISSPITSVTVLAPTNEAFAAALSALGLTAAQLLARPDLVGQVLRYHVVPVIVLSTAATPAGVRVATLEGSNVTFTSSNGVVRVNNARVLIPNVRAGLSIVHVIDQVLIPPSLSNPTPTPTPTPATGSTLLDVARSVPELSTLVAAIQASPAIAAAARDRNTAVTVFAPTNAAFQSLLARLRLTPAQLLRNERLLTVILSYHVVPSVVRSSNITRRTTLHTLLENADLTVEISNRGVLVNRETRVIRADVSAGRSVVHVVDQVLLPPFWRVLLDSLTDWVRNIFG